MTRKNDEYTTLHQFYPKRKLTRFQFFFLSNFKNSHIFHEIIILKLINDDINIIQVTVSPSTVIVYQFDLYLKFQVHDSITVIMIRYLMFKAKTFTTITQVEVYFRTN